LLQHHNTAASAIGCGDVQLTVIVEITQSCGIEIARIGWIDRAERETVRTIQPQTQTAVETLAGAATKSS